MKRVKLFSRKNIILSLLLCAIICIAAAFGLNFGVYAADREVTISGSSVFYTSPNARVWAYDAKPTEPFEGDSLTLNDGTAGRFYSMFVFSSDEDTVGFRKDLAFRWYEDSNPVPEEEEGSEPATTASPAKKDGFFSMRIGFNDVNFERFLIKFESQQFALTKDNKTANYVIFVPNGADKVSAIITDDPEAELPEGATAFDAKDITVAFTGYSTSEVKERNSVSATRYGVYDVTVSQTSAPETKTDGFFDNIGGTFSDFSSSSTNPVQPLTFSVKYNKPAGGDEDATNAQIGLIMYELNNQKFELKRGSISKVNGHLEGGRIVDTAAPVLCLEEELRFIEEGNEINFDFTVIDVLTTSPSYELSYYLLKNDQATASDYNYDDYLKEGLFEKVTSSDDRYLMHHKDDYTPQAADINEEIFSEKFDFKAQGAVKICLKLTDTTATGGKSAYTMLDWYVPDNFKVKVNGGEFIAVAKDEKGATYAHTYYDNSQNKYVTDLNTAAWTEAVEAYAEKVKELTTEGENPKLSAGNNNYFYLPSAEGLVTDNATAYEDMTFAIYYIRAGSRQSNTGRSANNLSINLTAREKYIFTIYATDAASNNMFYVDEDGEEVEFSTGDIWNMYDDEDKKGYLPWFEFEVTYTGVTVEDPEVQNTAYVGESYGSASFDINGLDYEASYKLFIFNKEEWYELNEYLPTFNEFLEEIVSDPDKFHAEYRNYFNEIRPASAVAEGDPNYDEAKAYNFSSSGTTFTPQEANAYYCILLSVKDKNSNADPTEKLLGIVSSARPAALEGESHWLQDNVASIVLLAVAGAALIGIVLLLVIRPKNKGDIDGDALLQARKVKKSAHDEKTPDKE